MSMRKIMAIFKKQLKDTLKNKMILVQFVMFPLLAVLMTNAIKLPDTPQDFFVKLFSVMYIGMAPLTGMAAILAEEKEKNTLRVLMMSNVKAVEYLAGVGCYVFFICMLGAVVLGVTGHYQGELLLRFLLIMGVGILLSVLTGAAIGVLCKNQMSATSLAVPFMLVLAFLPMISMFNEKVERISRFLYSQQLNNLMDSVANPGLSGGSLATIAVNALVIAALFALAYRKCGLS